MATAVPSHRKRIAGSEQRAAQKSVLLAMCCRLFAVLLSSSLLVGLSGCGPAPSDHAPSLDSSASIAGGGLTPFPASREGSVPLGTGTVAGGKGDSPQGTGSRDAGACPRPETCPADKLIIPHWIVNDLASPDAQVRLQAVDRWAQSAPTGSVDTLIQALEDRDEQVQARALELIVQDWVREQATGQGHEARGDEGTR